MADPIKTLDDMERLFLLELLVDSVQINYEKVGLDNCEISSLKQACVRFQFLNYPVLEICEEDFCNITEDYQKDQIEFKSGKSCLFSLRGIPPDVRCFEICVSVLRQKTAGSCVLLGRTRINLGSSFTNILTTMEGDCSSGPVARTSKDTHPLLSEKGEIVGKITVFVRLSCFGKMIITQFQVSGEENKSFLFKGASEPKDLSDLGPLGDPSTLSDPFARGTPAGDASMGTNQQNYSHQENISQTAMPAQNTQNYSHNNSPNYNTQSGFIGRPGIQQHNQGFGEFSGNMENNQEVYDLTGSQGMTGIMQGVPGIMQGVPGTMQGVPGMMQGVPGMMQGVPGMMQGVPGVPEIPGNMSGLLGATYGAPGNNYGYPTSAPGFPELPNIPGQVPGIMGTTPAGGMTGAFPGVPPESTGNNDEATDKDYKEIGVEINGHSLSIKIPRREKKPKCNEQQLPFCGKINTAPSESTSESTSDNESTAPQQQPQIPGIEFCGCDYPLPPGFGCTPPSQPPKKKKKKKKEKPKCPLELQGNYCMKQDCPMGYPQVPTAEKKPGCPPFELPGGAIGVKGDQVVFQMPSGAQGQFPSNTNAFYNFGSNIDSNLQKVQMMNDVEAAKAVLPDPRNDIFLLKVGKKNVITEKRAKMEVEIKSPRKEEVKMVDEQTQYLESDVGPVTDKKAAEKGKKGKGKGKGKGKKK